MRSAKQGLAHMANSPDMGNEFRSVLLVFAYP